MGDLGRGGEGRGWRMECGDGCLWWDGKVGGAGKWGGKEDLG